MRYLRAHSNHPRLRTLLDLVGGPLILWTLMVRCPRCQLRYVADPPALAPPPRLSEEERQRAITRLAQECPAHEEQFTVGDEDGTPGEGVGREIGTGRERDAVSPDEQRDLWVREFVGLWLPANSDARLAEFLGTIPRGEWDRFRDRAEDALIRVHARAVLAQDAVGQTRTSLLRQALAVEARRRRRHHDQR